MSNLTLTKAELTRLLSTFAWVSFGTFALLVWCLKNRLNYFDRCWSNQLPYRRLR